MKKMAATVTVVLALLFGFWTASYAAEPREFISETLPQEFSEITGDIYGQAIDSFEFSSKNDGNIDYGIMIYITNHGMLHVFFSLITEKNSAGELVVKESSMIAFVLLDEGIAWYKSAETKKIYNDAKKAYEAAR